jgi:hypothetical protein
VVFNLKKRQINCTPFASPPAPTSTHFEGASIHNNYVKQTHMTAIFPVTPHSLATSFGAAGVDDTSDLASGPSLARQAAGSCQAFWGSGP